MMNVQGLYFVVLLCTLSGMARCQDYREMIEFENCSIVDEDVAQEKYKSVMLRFFTGKNASDPQQRVDFPFSEGEKMVANNKFDKSKCLQMYNPGWNTRNNDTRATKLMNALLQSNTSNVVQFVWDSVTIDTPYVDSVSLMAGLAPLVAPVMDKIRDAGVQCIFLMGHSLGAQHVGAIGRQMKKRPNRIMGLDPAGPGFTVPVNCSRPLNKDDADCVTILHTDAGGLGTPETVGIIDHWANGGVRIQPNCSEVNTTKLIDEEQVSITGCSHNRAVEIATAALLSPSSVISRRCSSLLAFEVRLCLINPVIPLFQGCDSKTRPGQYFLRTNGKEPLGKGSAGTRPGSIIFGK